MKSLTLLVLAMLLMGAPLWADSLTHNGTTYNNVYIREGNSSYYVQDPATGSVTAVPKGEAGDVNISSDGAERESLLARWKAAKPERQDPALTAVARAPEQIAPRAAVRMPAEPSAAAPGRSEGGGVNVKLKNVPMRTALRAALRQQNLDYQVRDEYIYVSTPQRLRQEPLDYVQPRLFSMNNVSDTLPKIVVRNPGGAYPQMGYGGGMGGGNYGGGMGMGGYGGGMQGGMGMGGYGGGMQGGMGMGGMGMGGMGGMRGGMGMMGGGYGGGQHFSNISDLFSTIDDRLVGETPAVIGIGGISTGPSRPVR